MGQFLYVSSSHYLASINLSSFLPTQMQHIPDVRHGEWGVLLSHSAINPLGKAKLLEVYFIFFPVTLGVKQRFDY